jgi:hydrogenase expression/formation protein HypC
VDVVDHANQLAQVEVAGVRRTISVGLLDIPDLDSLRGQWVLIHVGFAISKVDEAEAEATLKLLGEMGTEYEQELDELKGSSIE